jgi:hypothetical protein
MRSLTAERRANRGREGGEEKEREKGEREKIKKKKVSFMSAHLRTADCSQASLLWGEFNNFPIKKNEWPARFSWLLLVVVNSVRLCVELIERWVESYFSWAVERRARA